MAKKTATAVQEFTVVDESNDATENGAESYDPFKGDPSDIDVKVEGDQNDSAGKTLKAEPGVEVKEEGDAERNRFTIPNDIEKDLLASLEETPKPHPYQVIVDSFKIAEHQSGKVEPVELHKKPIVIISDAGKLKELIENLMKLKEISIHALHTSKFYTYIVPIVLIGTDTENYLIDTIKLKTNISLLNQVFINPKIVKVVYNDAVLGYLQRELNMFLINVFELRVGRQVLGLPIKNHFQFVRQNGELSSLISQSPYGEIFMKRPIDNTVKEFCNKLVLYLLQHYRELRNQLIDISEDVYAQVLDKSNKKAQFVFKDIKTAKFMEVVMDIKAHHAYQWKLFSELYKWRDALAKKFNSHPDIILDRKNLERIVVGNFILEVEVKKIAKSDYVDRDIDEVMRIIRDSKHKLRVIHIPAPGDNRNKKKNKPGTPPDSMRNKVNATKRLERKTAARRSIDVDQSKRRRLGGGGGGSANSSFNRSGGGSANSSFNRGGGGTPFRGGGSSYYSGPSPFISPAPQQDPNFINQISENIIKIAANLSNINSGPGGSGSNQGNWQRDDGWRGNRNDFDEPRGGGGGGYGGGRSNFNDFGGRGGGYDDGYRGGYRNRL